jgi:hypothetical protein
MNGYKALGLKINTWKRLNEICKKGQTYDDCINKLIDFYHREHRFKIGE